MESKLSKIRAVLSSTCTKTAFGWPRYAIIIGLALYNVGDPCCLSAQSHTTCRSGAHALPRSIALTQVSLELDRDVDGAQGARSNKMVAFGILSSLSGDSEDMLLNTLFAPVRWTYQMLRKVGAVSNKVHNTVDWTRHDQPRWISRTEASSMRKEYVDEFVPAPLADWCVTYSIS